MLIVLTLAAVDCTIFVALGAPVMLSLGLGAVALVTAAIALSAVSSSDAGDRAVAAALDDEGPEPDVYRTASR